MAHPDPIAAFWRAFVEATEGVDEARFTGAFAFGDGAAMADELAALVLQGTKRATASALWAYEAEGEALPRPGDLSIVADGSGTPRCVIETLAVEVVPFREVTEAFAHAEGEGDRSLAYWRRVHRAFFTRELAAAGQAFDASMPVVCERFEVRYPLPAEAS
jgi:uncharacterized protein YhfF